MVTVVVGDDTSIPTVHEEDQYLIVDESNHGYVTYD